MSTISNSSLPGFDPVTFRSFMRVVQSKWVLPPEYQASADFYFLRHWTARLLSAKLQPDGITIQGVTYFPIHLTDTPLNQVPDDKLYWLSFRAVRYPLGSDSEHPWALKCYVLIQEDRSWSPQA